MNSGLQTYVPTDEIKHAVEGRERSILDALGIKWPQRGKDKIDCPYPSHGDKSKWRWDDKNAKAFCTCRKPHSIIDVVAGCEGLSFGEPDMRALLWGVGGRASTITCANPAARPIFSNSRAVSASPLGVDPSLMAESIGGNGGETRSALGHFRRNGRGFLSSGPVPKLRRRIGQAQPDGPRPWTRPRES